MSARPDTALGLEARSSDDDHLSLRLWLRLLACSTQIESEIRRRLRGRFDTTLARFDYLAQLHRHPEGLAMSVLSRCLMVTGGSITGLTDQLQREGLVQREPVPRDRRSSRLKLTPLGRSRFEHMASEHEAWVVELFAGLAAEERRTLHTLLGRLRRSAELPEEVS
jgi:DNA-binding MarR family transcriptional regulator